VIPIASYHRIKKQKPEYKTTEYTHLRGHGIIISKEILRKCEKELL
jgi:hypothetical protein